MKILMASDAYKFQTNGVVNVVITLVEGLRKRGHEVKALIPSNCHRSFRDGDDYYIASIPAFYYPDTRISPVRDNAMIKELKAWHPDIIHIHSEASMERLARSVARVHHTPIVMTTHTDYVQFLFGKYSKARPARWVGRTWGRRTYRGVRRVIAPSEKALTFPHMKTALNRAVVIPNGIRLENYQKRVSPEERAALFRELGLADNGRTIVMITRISHEKRIGEILRYLPALLREVPDAQLIIVGDGPTREKLEAYTRDQGLSRCVRFTGRIPPTEVYRYYGLGNLFVSASTFEVHSLSYLEAMARGLPLVCRSDACLKGVLEQGVNGYAYTTEEEFVRFCAEILTNPDLQAKMKQSALQRVEDFSSERFVEHTLELYERVIREAAQEAGPEAPGNS